MGSVRVRALILALVLTVAGTSLLTAADRDRPGTADFLSFDRTGPASAVLQTSVTRYRHPHSGQVVSLVGAVHIGEPSYYQAIQAELDQHDLALYELVGGPAPGSPEAAEQDPPDSSDFASRLGFIQVLQQEMQSMLQLDHQMNCIDYTRHNLRHADLNARDFQIALAEHGLFNIDPVALFTGIGPAMLEGFGLQAALASQDENSVNRIRWMMGKMMANSVSQMAILGVDDIEKPEDLILGIRNDQAWKVLQKSIPEGWRRIAIFYGAAHLPDLRRRLLQDGWMFEQIEWIPAWRIPVEDPAAEQISIAREARL
ncbi:MAG: hypothetical protein VX764_07665 [Planctomycetota bacterium]|nr:hypothetical protein [Planctomycetota bacterium]